jgi:predicted RNA binding protein YcfA (HicA-like mRNA interferase family)
MDVYYVCMDSRSLIQLLKQNGWVHAKGRGKGDYEIFTKDGFPPITVPHPRRDLATGTLHSILKLAGLK